MHEASSNRLSGEASAHADSPLLAALIQHAPIGIAFVDLDLRFVRVNDTLAAISGLPAAEHIGRSLTETLGDLAPALGTPSRRVLDTSEPVTSVAVMRSAEPGCGEDRHWLADFYPVHDAAGHLAGVGVTTVDLTGQKLAEERHRAIVAAMPDFVFELSSDGTHLNFHAPAEERLFVQPAKIVGRRVRDLLPAEVADKYERVIERTLRTDSVQLFEYVLGYADGPRHFEGRMVRTGPDRVLAVVRDISERVESERGRQLLEEQLRQAQKMEAVGQLAGGVAHDFNNLLTIINGYVEMALDHLPPDGSVREAMLEVQKAGEHARTLTRQLLLFSRQQILEPKILDLNDIVGNLHKMLSRIIGEDVALTVDLADGLGAVKVDQGQIEQALLNLAVNARDAMPAGGTLGIATANVRLDEVRCRTLDGATPGDYVMVSMTDSGVGMDDATRARIFEPFFTTKGAGKGSGLGLAVVFGVVKQSGGFITVASAPGAGTTATLYFPWADGEASPAGASASSAPMPRGSEVILLVEDDTTLRAMTRRILERCGYTLLEAGDGREAIDLLERYGGPLHLLLSDVVMPNVGGGELAEIASRMRPDIRVLFLSGYTDDAVVRQGIRSDGFAFLQKPFTSRGLAEKVRTVLDASR